MYKRTIFVIVMCIIAMALNIKAQPGPKFSTWGNPLNNDDFIGSTNNQPLVIKTNNTEWIRITPTGNVGVGTSIAGYGYKMDVAGRTHGYGFYADSTMMALEVRAQLLRAGYVIADSAGMSKIVSTIIYATKLYGVDIYASRIDVVRLSADTITSPTGTVQFGSNNLNTSGTINSGNVTTSTLNVSGTSTLNSVILNDGITVTPLAGSGEGLTKFNNNGQIGRLNFTGNNNEFLAGSGTFKDITPYINTVTGWQWYDTTVLLSTAPVVAIQNNLVVGNRVSIGAIRMSNGTGVDSLRTARQFAMEAQKIFLRADSVIVKNRLGTERVYSPTGTIALEADTVQMAKYARAEQVQADSMRAQEIISDRMRTVALQVSGDIAAYNGTVNSNEVRANTITTNDLTVFGSTTFDSIRVSHIKTNKIVAEDTTGIITLGDSTMYVYTGLHLITSDNTRGITIGNTRMPVWPPCSGDPFVCLLAKLFIGFYQISQQSALAPNSYALGYNLRTSTSANYSVVIGSGINQGGYTAGYVPSGYLENNISNSLMVGFNSDIPTLFVGPSNGTGTTGVVRIGKRTITSGTHTDYKLSVDGKIVATKVVTTGLNWQDKELKRRFSLDDLNKEKLFVEKNSHLEGIPSEKEVIENGIDMGQMHSLHLRKTEQLFKYLFLFDDEINKLKEENNNLKNENVLLNNRISDLEKRIKMIGR